MGGEDYRMRRGEGGVQNEKEMYRMREGCAEWEGGVQNEREGESGGRCD